MYGSISGKDRDSESIPMLVGRKSVDAENHIMSMKLASVSIIAIQIAFIFFFSWTGSRILMTEKSSEFVDGYSTLVGLEIVVFVGFGYLMTFIKKYGVGAVGLTMMISAIGVQWAFFTEAFFASVYSGDDPNYSVDIAALIPCFYAVAAVVISFGAVVGKISPLQLVIMTIMEIMCYSYSKQVILVGNFGVADCGGTIVVHMFGAYFGLAVSYAIGDPGDEPSVSYVSDTFSFIGTLFLWLYWPTFVGGNLSPGSHEQQHAFLNTTLCLASSTCTAFSLSSLLSDTGKFRPVDIQHATLAGGVAIGAVANLSLTPAMVALIGAAAGIVSTYCFAYLQPYLAKSYGIFDTCGINNLHGVPSILGGLLSAIFPYYLQKAGHLKGVDEQAFSSHDDGDQATFQLYSMMWTFCFAIVSGGVTGAILRGLDKGQRFPKFKDHVLWE